MIEIIFKSIKINSVMKKCFFTMLARIFMDEDRALEDNDEQ
jgi:hypothetical protein